MFTVTIITLVPELWQHLLGKGSGLVGRAFLPESPVEVQLNIVDLKSFGHGVHRQVDDAPFGGGAGMVLTVPPLHKAIMRARELSGSDDIPVCLLGPRGKVFDQKKARALAEGSGITLICGRYEGVDERVRAYVHEELSIGDMVLSAGDPAAWAIVDAVVRLRPLVLGNAESIKDESFSLTQGSAHIQGGLEYPHYTRPAEYEGALVPDVLRSGNHKAIALWRAKEAQALTHTLRPDLLGARGKRDDETK